MDYKLSDLFSFEQRDIGFHMLEDMNMSKKFKDAFKYVAGKLPVHSVQPLEKMEWAEGKNYDWAQVKDGSVTLLMRKYRTHFTVYFHNKNEKCSYFSKYGCFTILSNFDKMKGEVNDKYVEDNFIDMDAMLQPLIDMIKDNNVNSIWNSYSLKRPEHVEVKNVWNGGEELTSIDLFIFCCEELFDKYLEYFSENDMLERIKSVQVGDMLGAYKVTRVATEVEDDYYYDAGIEWQNTNFPESKTSWQDVYCLTRYYLEYLFPE